MNSRDIPASPASSPLESNNTFSYLKSLKEILKEETESSDNAEVQNKCLFCLKLCFHEPQDQSNMIIMFKLWIDHQQIILRVLHKCVTPMYISLFYKYYMAWIHGTTRYAPDYDSRISLNRVYWLNINFFFDIRNLHCIMSLINFIFIFSSGLEIFSKLNIHHHGCHFIDAIYKFDLAQNCYPSQWPVQYVQLTNAI